MLMMVGITCNNNALIVPLNDTRPLDTPSPTYPSSTHGPVKGPSCLERLPKRMASARTCRHFPWSACCQVGLSNIRQLRAAYHWSRISSTFTRFLAPWILKSSCLCFMILKVDPPTNCKSLLPPRRERFIVILRRPRVLCLNSTKGIVPEDDPPATSC